MSIPYNEAHPIILPVSSSLVKRMIELLHITTLHGGTQLMLNELYQQYWIPRVTRVVQGISRKCVRCLRHAARPATQQMAPLPPVRVTPIIAFEAAGVDYAGPILALSSRTRGSKTTKGYFAIFICIFSRGIHIELVSDLTTDFESKLTVCSFKHHLYRVIGDSTLTSEELRMLTTQIEACLNSRPICPQSS